MSKLTAWLVTLVGLVLILANSKTLDISMGTLWGWIIALAVLIVGLGKLFRNYSNKKRR
jgi:hypothetical protein